MQGEEGSKASGFSSSQPCQLWALRQELAEWVYPDTRKRNFPFCYILMTSVGFYPHRTLSGVYNES